MDGAAAERLLATSPLLDERVVRFECGCNPQKMLAALRVIFEGKAEELFLGEPAVEAHCPRCGRRWWIPRERF